MRNAIVAGLIAKRERQMLKSVGKPSLLLKLGAWRCMCMRRKTLDAGVLARIRPFDLLGFACWCDRADGG